MAGPAGPGDAQGVRGGVILPYVAAAALSAGLYLFFGSAAGLGFPLDDSWIHQTIARNLVQHGEWSINPGEPAAVSTSPLWTLLVALGQAVAIEVLLPWTHILGTLCLAWIAWETAALGRSLFPDSRVPFLAAGAVVFEWHLVWAALSGMETLLFTALSLAAIRVGYPVGRGLVTRPTARQAAFAGLLAGLLTATRPEGLLLAGLLSLHTRAVAFAAAVAAVLLPIALLNLAVGGSPLPSTFYAKNAAYAGGDAGLAFLGGAVVELARGLLLVLYPGLVYGLTRVIASSPHRLIAGWVIGLLAVYAIWLPALYHHGRYLMPLIPLLLLYGVAGTRLLLGRLRFRVLPRAGAVIAVGVLAISWVRGAQVYGENVRYVNQNHVAVARWLRDDTPMGSVIATHDIGALGYLSGRYLVDIAGLATPELRTSTRDVGRVLEVLDQRGVSYVAVLPDFYPPLTEGVYRAGRYREVHKTEAFVVLERVSR